MNRYLVPARQQVADAIRPRVAQSMGIEPDNPSAHAFATVIAERAVNTVADRLLDAVRYDLLAAAFATLLDEDVIRVWPDGLVAAIDGQSCRLEPAQLTEIHHLCQTRCP